jgi:hypothetical protein
VNIILPILIVSLVVGVAAKRMNALLWMLVGLVILVSIGDFWLHN